MSDYQSISVKEAMSNVASNQYLLPAIQRKFVWNMDQIEMLFDSILRGYPINSFMFWKITNTTIKQDFKFYQFIKDYVQKFNEDNPDAPSQLLSNDFHAVIDGQQRLTSLYIGLIGSYKVKKPSKWWQDTEANTQMVRKELYLEITEELTSIIDNEKEYNFSFMSQDELLQDKQNNPSHFWFKVGDVLRFNDLSDVNLFLIQNSLISNKFTMRALTELFSKINEKKLINYYEVDDQNQDKVLDIFIRTNSGGTPLSFSDLLMSIASANWTIFDARDEMSQIRKEIYGYGNPNFDVSQDFILKSLLVLSGMDVRFKIQNFGKTNIAVFESKWDEIKKSLVATFHLLEELNFNDSLLRAKNAAIPIAYYIYKNRLWDDIVKTTYDSVDKKNISLWLSMSLLKGIFGGTSDNILKVIRDVIDKTTTRKFPTQEIIDAFKTGTKNYSFTDDIIQSFLKEQYGTPVCGMVLNLLYPDVVLEHGKEVAQDHMHPKTMFEAKGKLDSLNLSQADLEFFKNKENYNSCLNLQLLESLQNKSKGDTNLKTWATQKNKKNSDLYIDQNISLELKDFKKFIENRSKVIFNKLKSILTK